MQFISHATAGHCGPREKATRHRVASTVGRLWSPLLASGRLRSPPVASPVAGRRAGDASANLRMPANCDQFYRERAASIYPIPPLVHTHAPTTTLFGYSFSRLSKFNSTRVERQRWPRRSAIDLLPATMRYRLLYRSFRERSIV